MIKKTLSILLCLALVLSMAGCGKYFFPDKNVGDPPVENTPQQSTPEPEVTPENQPEAETPSAEPEFEILPDNLVGKLERAAYCFAIAPEEFSDPSTLSDDAKLYAALLRGAGEFLPIEGDDYRSYLPLDSVAGLVESVFGEGVTLSEGYESGSYYPYEISLSEGRVYRYSEDIGYQYFFTTEAVKNADGSYTLKLANLQDPDFYYVYGEFIADGLQPTKAMVDEFEGELMTYCYTLRESGSSYIITSFLYENYEDIWSEVY